MFFDATHAICPSMLERHACPVSASMFLAIDHDSNREVNNDPVVTTSLGGVEAEWHKHARRSRASMPPNRNLFASFV
jgi:hypothetical protein